MQEDVMSRYEDGPFIVFQNIENGFRGYAQYDPTTDYTRNWQKAVIYTQVAIVDTQEEARKLVFENSPPPVSPTS